MSLSHRRIGVRKTACAVAVLTLLASMSLGGAATGAPGGAKASPQSTKAASAVYIVQMADSPVVAYEGGVAGLPATKPAQGQKANPNSSSVRRYQGFLNNSHAAALAAVGAPGTAKFYDYNFSFNGFAATLTPGQAAQLASRPDVVSVSHEQFRQPQTDTTPAFLGLSTPGGLWEQLGGQGAAGEDVIIGVIDTGIWPEHPSFSDQADLADRPGASGNANRVYDAPTDWFGTCQTGELWSKDDCNNKLIGARYFLHGLSRSVFGVPPEDYASARDKDGHGTHTSSTAGGNAGVDPSIFGRDLGVGTISGMAPRARIAAYKACFGPVGCALSDLVASIDTAVADGVDVINYSIGSDTPELDGMDDVAFLFASDAGVFVSTSAGNAGPGASTIGSPSADPWVMTVGANTTPRYFLSDITLGNGATYVGGSVGTPLPATKLVDADAVDGPPDDDGGNGTCVDGRLDPLQVTGAIVLCLRQVGVARVEHSNAVKAAGGVGMILYDPPQPSVRPTDNHSVPTVHVHADVAAQIKEYIASAGASATAAFSGGTARPNDDDHVPKMAGFSSRGPNGAVGDIIKPDVTAPGVQILAGAAPNPWDAAPGQLFQAIQGTSMSSPHGAGVGALLVQAHPDWTPGMIKSALMTTGSQNVFLEDDATPAGPFAIGGGFIQPTPASDPGLVYATNGDDYRKLLCAMGLVFVPGGRTCTRVGSTMDPSDLNLASIGIDKLAGVQTVTRTVTNVDDTTATYTASVVAPSGVLVTVQPSTFTLAAGASQSYTVTFTSADDAVFDVWTFGSLTWTGGGHTVRSPIAVRPVALSFPDEVSGEGTSGSLEYQVQFGYTGDFNTAVHGLFPAEVTHDTVVDDPASDIAVALETGVGINTYTITVPADTRHLRTSLFDETTGDGLGNDLDLYLFAPGDAAEVDNIFAVSGTPTATEQIDVANPEAGDWTLVVHGWETEGPSAEYDLFTWLVEDADAGNLTATAPTTAVTGGVATVTLNWTGLTADARYLGAVSYDDGTTELGSTLVSIHAVPPAS
jgi:Subtilase family/Fibronectin type-III domain/Peptidase inhibitor I9/PA domain/Bacterial pre-peptidase C-terminal domain